MLKHSNKLKFFIFSIVIISNYGCENNSWVKSFYCESYSGNIISFSKNSKGFISIILSNDSVHYFSKMLSVECRDKLMIGDSVVKKKSSLKLEFYRDGYLNCSCSNDYFKNQITSKCDTLQN